MFFLSKNVLNEGEKKEKKTDVLSECYCGPFFCPAAQYEMHNLFISNNTGRNSI